MSKLVKIYGERNTNTNYLSQLIGLNLKAEEIPGVVPARIMALQRRLPGNELVRDLYFFFNYGQTLGWKHTCVKPAAVLSRRAVMRSHEVCFVTLTKNPYSWLLSLHRNPYHQRYVGKPDFETFLRTPWRTLRRENTAKVLRSPIELWNLKNAAYLQLASLDALNLTSESLIEDPEAVIDRISRQFSIDRRSARFVNYERSTKRETGKDHGYYQDYYRNERWRNELSAEAIAIINEGIDQELMARFGFAVLS